MANETDHSGLDEFADYVLELAAASRQTSEADDRLLYVKYLADAAVLLALLATRADRAAVEAAVNSHERLWGHTWLKDDAFKKPASAFGGFKERFLAR